MKEFIEKLIGGLEEKENEAVLKAPNTNDISNIEYQKWMMKSYGFKESIEIVNQLAEEYNNGWIPCSERLPENTSTVLVQIKEFESPTIGWYGNIAGWRLLEKDFDELNDFTVIAWQPLPAPYQSKGE